MPTTINGTTGVSQVQDNTITSAKIVDGSVSQVDLATNVAGNAPAFSAYQSTLQSLPTTTATKLVFQTKEFDTGSYFDATTNYRFQPLVAGYYQVSGAFNIATVTASLIIWIYKNGTQFKQLFSANSAGVAAGSALVFLNGSTDYVELFASQSAAAQNTVATSSSTYFQAAMVRSA